MSLINNNSAFHEGSGRKAGFFTKNTSIHPDAEADIDYHHHEHHYMSPSVTARGKLGEGIRDDRSEDARSVLEGNFIGDIEAHRKVPQLHIEQAVSANLKPKGVLGVALEFVDKANGSRFRKAKKLFEDEDQRINDIDCVLLYAAAEDLAFVEGLSKPALLEALIRREAWKTRPYTMGGIVLAQILLCVTAMLSFNEPVNTSTTVMTIIFLASTASSNPFQVNKDLIKLLKKRGRPIVKKLGVVFFVAIVCVLSPILIPISIAVLCYTFIFDLMVGRIEDNTFGELANVMVNTIVISTALSVGIRSGNPISAIQTFAGFEFISRMDEALMSQMKFDPYSDYHIPSRPEAKLKKAYVRAILYIFVPSVVLFAAYITFSNACVTFCSNDNPFDSKLVK